MRGMIDIHMFPLLSCPFFFCRVHFAVSKLFANSNVSELRSDYKSRTAISRTRGVDALMAFVTLWLQASSEQLGTASELFVS